MTILLPITAHRNYWNNRKKSIAKLLFDLFNLKQLNAGLISTVAIQYSDREFKATHTTPDPLTINRHLSDMVEQELNTVLWKFLLMVLPKKSFGIAI